MCIYWKPFKRTICLLWESQKSENQFGNTPEQDGEMKLEKGGELLLVGVSNFVEWTLASFQVDIYSQFSLPKCKNLLKTSEKPLTLISKITSTFYFSGTSSAIF